MDMLSGLLGGQQGQEFQDFTQRYEQGAPWDGISDQEAVQRYQQVAPNLPPQVFEQSAQQSFSRLSPQQRMELGQYLARQAPQHGVQFPDVNMDGRDDRLQDPSYLAQMTGQLHRQEPGLLGQMLGGATGAGPGMGGSAGGGLLASPIAKAALAGIAAMAVKNMAGRR